MASPLSSSSHWEALSTWSHCCCHLPAVRRLIRTVLQWAQPMLQGPLWHRGGRNGQEQGLDSCCGQGPALPAGTGERSPAGLEQGTIKGFVHQFQGREKPVTSLVVLRVGFFHCREASGLSHTWALAHKAQYLLAVATGASLLYKFPYLSPARGWNWNSPSLKAALQAATDNQHMVLQV